VIKKLLTILFVALLSCKASTMSAQEESYKFDFGAQVGMSGYMGDASSSIFSHPGIAGGLSFRYLPDVRWALRTVLNVTSLSGNTADMDDYLHDGAQYSFKSTVADLGERLEFNFFSYGIGETYKRLRRWSPYLTVGFGFTLASCSGQTSFGVNIPMGVGVKYKIKERLNFGFEFLMTKVFSDKVDQLSDLYQIQSSFIKNTDWYSNISVSLTYEFGKRCSTCHYVD
jgi:hypothetical protein